jgi:predicted HicB family RNase H-like nuclease
MATGPNLDAVPGNPRYESPEDLAVQLNMKVPWHYREQLTRMAKEANLSLNRFVVNAIVRAYPPERK